MRILTLVTAASVAAAQVPSSFYLPPLTPAAESRIADFVAGSDLGPLLDDANTLTELIERESALASLRRSESLRSAAGLLRARRADTLEGIATSLVARAGLASLVTATLDSGAFERDAQGLRTTFRFNAFGLHSLFSPSRHRACAITNPLCDTPGQLALRGLSGSVTFERQPNAAEPGANLGAGRVAAVTVRFQSLDRREPDAESFRQAVAQSAAERSARLQLVTESLDGIWDDETRNAAMQRFRARIQRDFSRVRAVSDEEKLLALVEAYQRALAELAPAFRRGYLAPLRLANLNAERALTRALAAALLKPAFSVEFTRHAALGQIPTAQVRYALDRKLWKDGSDYHGLLTLNGGASVYERLPVGTGARPWRDAQLALQFDRKLGAPSSRRRPAFSLAARAEHQFARGLIAVVQAKLTIRLGAALTLPLACSWSNRSELVNTPHLRTQFGLGINLDSLLAKE